MKTVTVLNTPCVLTDAPRLTAALAEHCRTPGRSALSVDFTNVHIVAMRRTNKIPHLRICRHHIWGLPTAGHDTMNAGFLGNVLTQIVSPNIHQYNPV